MMGSVYAERWIKATLLATPAVTTVVGERISHAPAPPQWAGPFAVYQLVAPTDMQPIGMPTAAESLLYQIELVDNAANASFPSHTDRIDDAAEAMHQALHFQSGIVSNHEVSAMREREVPRTVSQAGDRVFRHLGGEYRLFVAPIL